MKPKLWVYEVEHAGKKYLRGVSEGALVRAVNGWLVAAVRTDLPPRYYNMKHSDNFEGTAVSISKDDGKTWSELNWLYDAGRHHANLQRLPMGDLVMTVIVRDDIVNGSNGEYASYRRGCEAFVSRDNGLTWNLDRKFVLHTFEHPDPGNAYPTVCGHIGAAVLDDGSVLSAYGHYPKGATVLVKWRPDAGPARPFTPAPAAQPAAEAVIPLAPFYSLPAQAGIHYRLSGAKGKPTELLQSGLAWIDVPLHERIASLAGEATLEFILRPERHGGFAYVLRCADMSGRTPHMGFGIAYDLRQMKDNPQLIYSDERVQFTPAHYSAQVHSESVPKPFESAMHQLAYVVRAGHGAFYRDGVRFSRQRESGTIGKEQLFKFCLDKAGSADKLRLAVGAYPRPESIGSPLRGGLCAVRIYNRALSADELNQNRAATLGDAGK